METNIESLAKIVESHSDYRVLRRLIQRSSFHDLKDIPLSKGIILEETTGLNSYQIFKKLDNSKSFFHIKLRMILNFIFASSLDRSCHRLY